MGAIICVLMYWIKNIKKKIQYFKILSHIHSTEWPQAANFRHTNATPNARFFVHLVKPLKKCILSILYTFVQCYFTTVLWHNIKHFYAKYHPLSSTYNSVHVFELLKIKVLQKKNS